MKRIVKSIYKIIPFKHALLKFIKTFWTPPQYLRNGLRFNGIIKIEIDNGKFFKMSNKMYAIENEFFWLGKSNDWEKQSLRIWETLCKGKSIIFDIGANTGIYSLIAKTVNPNCQVFAFEPQPNINRSLNENNQLNKLNITCEKVALSDTNGTASFFNYGDAAFTGNTTAGSLNKLHRPEDQHSIDVECQTLATYIEKNNLSKIELMKIDVETHEIEVINGMGKYLEQFKPIILIEIIDDKIGDYVFEKFSKLSYKFYYIDDIKGMSSTVNNLKHREYNNYILSPFELPFL
ncbi:FkbM family methyltransferase [Emticicia sp.]|uniref:FkbM family methyltransferase n=1 Tax=Emticicia sp. TaxID=1930953 RepID=UPI0037501829